MDISQLAEQYNSGIRNFQGINLAETNLTGIDLSGADLSQAKLSVTNLSEANLTGAKLTGAKLNVTRLSGANLQQANLNRVILNVANLIGANLKEAQLEEAIVLQAELVRAQMSQANLRLAELKGSDLREVLLKRANLTQADLRDTNLRGAILSSAILERANLDGANLIQSDLTGADLQQAELQQAKLSRANLMQADLRGADLRGADLSGANLRWADLRYANLTDAKLMRADLRQANLGDTMLVNTNLSQADLIQVNWLGADLTGATLTGAKLYRVSRFGVKAHNISCDWIDLSPEGDRSKIFELNPELTNRFFKVTSPKVKLHIDRPLSWKGNSVLATVYEKISSLYPYLKQPPSIEVNSHTTVLTFELESSDELFPAAYLAIFPFSDRSITHRHLVALLKQLKLEDNHKLNLLEIQRIQELKLSLSDIISKLAPVKAFPLESLPEETASFFQASTQTLLLNSNEQPLEIYAHPDFGKHFHQREDVGEEAELNDRAIAREAIPPTDILVEFITQDIHIPR